uniref:Plus3 domain-containing protein n=1 Tax=Elaeophora elaphi TaxID=1147741 RepID=A0A0R3RGF5_9BILA
MEKEQWKRSECPGGVEIPELKNRTRNERERKLSGYRKSRILSATIKLALRYLFHVSMLNVKLILARSTYNAEVVRTKVLALSVTLKHLECREGQLRANVTKLYIFPNIEVILIPVLAMSSESDASGEVADSASDVEVKQTVSSDDKVKNSSANGKSNSDSDDNKQTKARRSTRVTHQNKKVIESGTSEEDSDSDVEAATSSRKRKTDKKLRGRNKKVRAQTDSDEGSSDDSDKKSLVDEYDDDMFLDEEDRRRLEEMTEKDREAEIFKRVEQREILRARHAIQKKIKAQKEDNAGLSKKEKKERKKKEKEKKREKEARKKIVESDIDERNGAGGNVGLLHASSAGDDKDSDDYDEFQRPSEVQKKQKQKNAMADLVNRRKEKQEAAQKKKTQSHKSELDIDEVFGNDGSDVDYEKSSSSSSRSSSRSTSRSTSKSRTRSPSPEKKREVNCLADLARIRLSRFKISKIVHAPFFNKTVIGCFVRIGIGRNKEGRSVYRAAQILDVVETAKVYQLENTRTNKGLKLKHGEEERVYRLEFVSNSEFTSHEFNKWYDAMKSNNLAILTIDQVEKKEADIQKAVNYNYTDKDIELMVQEKMRFQKAPLNYALEKGNLIKLKVSSL